METSDFERFAEDLRIHAGLRAEFEANPQPDGLHVLRINGVEFFFYADGSGYDGWGCSIDPNADSN